MWRGALCSAAMVTEVGCSRRIAVPMEVQTRGLRNLHRYKVARHKSLVKERLRYSRNWFLNRGNNHELVETFAHEREAFENFGVYRHDSKDDRYVLSTSHLSDLPADQRLCALQKLMEERWKVRDGDNGFDRAKLLLEALECFSELRTLGAIGVLDELPEADQDTFLQYVESCCMFARRCAKSHPESVSVLIRVATICDEMRCGEKRDDVLRIAEETTHHLGDTRAYSRVGEEITLPPLTDLDRAEEIKTKFADDIRRAYPNLRDEKPPVEPFRYKTAQYRASPFAPLGAQDTQHLLAERPQL